MFVWSKIRDTSIEIFTSGHEPTCESYEGFAAPSRVGILPYGKGDHEIWHEPKTGRKVSIDHSMKSRHTANEILKKAGLPKAF